MEPQTQKTSPALLVILLIIVLVGIGLYAFSSKSSQDQANTNQNTTASSTVPAESDPTLSEGTTTPVNVNPFVSAGTKFSDGKRFTDTNYNFSIEYPKDWVIDRQDYASTSNARRSITLTKAGYKIVLKVNESVDTKPEQSSGETLINVGNIAGKYVLRYDEPMFNRNGNNGYFPLLANHENGAERFIRVGDYFYTIYYFLPAPIAAKDSYDKSIILEADKIVGTLKFK